MSSYFMKYDNFGNLLTTTLSYNKSLYSFLDVTESLGYYIKSFKFTNIYDKYYFAIRKPIDKIKITSWDYNLEGAVVINRTLFYTIKNN